MIEDIYGISKRLDFVVNVVSDRRAKRVLDVGCGTGENLTSLLARRFPETQFVAIDSDAASIAFATRENPADNARYLVEADAVDLGTFDLVIASEVIEHVEDPDDFLGKLRGFLAPDGRVVLTLPNGQGPFELASFVETVMHLTGAYRVLRTIKRWIRPSKAGPIAAGTLAVSPHINFFSYRKIQSVTAASGFRILAYRPRTFLCGFVFDQLMQSKRVIDWNARISDRLPPQMASAWMFLLAPSPRPGGPIYKRNAYARLRRYLNEKRWGLR
jgi:SAM-dependent methyltransferase